MTAGVPASARFPAAPALAALSAAALPLLDDPFEPLAWLLCVGVAFVVAVSPPAPALRLALATVAFGFLGRLAVFTLGPKSVYLRAEEAAALGLWVSLGWPGVRAVLADPERRARTTSAFVLFLGVVGVLFAASTARWGLRASITGGLYLARLLLLASFFVAARAVSRTLRDRVSVSTTVLGVIVALAALGLLQLTVAPDMHDLRRFFPAVNAALTDPHFGRLVSTVLDPNLLGAMLVMGVSLALARVLAGPVATRPVASLQLLLLVVATGLTVSRGSLLGLVTVFVAVTVLVRPRLAWLGVPLVGAVALLAPRLVGRFTEAISSPHGIPVEVLGFSLRPEPSAYARLQSWFSALEVVKTAPLQGVGYNNLGLALAEIGDPQAVLAGTDSSLLLVLATSGLLGLGALVWLLVRIARDGIAWRRDGGDAAWIGVGTAGAVASLVVTSTFTNALLFPPVVVLLWTLAGAVARPDVTDRDGAGDATTS